MTKLITAILIAIATTTTLQAWFISCECIKPKKSNTVNWYYTYNISSKEQIKEYNIFKNNYWLTCKRYNSDTNTSKTSKYC